MMKRTAIAVCLVLTASSISLHAQQGNTSNPRFYNFGWNQDGLLPAQIETKVVKGAPYSAEIVNESVQTLSDGNRIVHRVMTRVYRDSMGRVRREDERSAGGQLITITDPVSNRSVTLNTANKTAQESIGLKWINGYFIGTSRGLFDGTFGFSSAINGLWLRDSKLDSGRLAFGGYQFRNARAGRIEGSDYLEEHLPTRTIEGVAASGVRRTTTIPKGLIGNEQPIKIVSEEWTSADLQVLVLTDFNDPRTGRVTYKLQNIVRSEPDPALFKTPADYKVSRGVGTRR